MILLFSGVPGCGKTTLAKKLESLLRKQGTVKRFTSDELKPPVYKKLFRLLEENKGKYDFLLFDATFYKKEWRDKLISLAKDEKVIVVYVHCPLETAVERNKNREKPIPERALKAIASKIEVPEHPDVWIDTQKASIEELIHKVLEFIKKEIVK